ncbi:hypothetical protein, partial [Paraburkholderia hospita]|uniref:hypothetical protein n=1 Tax=Paraburkholderia hospita TaxID=169430 RepID=UPI000B701E20
PKFVSRKIGGGSTKPHPEGHEKLMHEIKGWEAAKATDPADIPPDAEMTSLVLKRMVSRKRGSWTQIGPEVPDEPSA